MAERELKLIEVKGSHEEIGKAIGEASREETRSNVELFLDELYKKASKEEIAKITNPLIQRCKHSFPDFFEELGGIAEGSRIGLDKTRYNFWAGLDKLIYYSLEEELLSSHHCTTIAARIRKKYSFGNTETHVLFGHNEDWNPDYKLYLVKAKPKGKPSFISLSYAGQLPGNSVGWNSCGIAYGGDSLDTKINWDGLPKTYVLRAILEAKSIDDVEKVISRGDRTIGNSSVAVSSLGDIVNFKWGPYNYTCAFAGGDYCASTDEGTRDGDIVQRARELLAEFVEKKGNMNDFRKILCDHKHNNGSPWSICEHAHEKTGKYHQTIASVIIESICGSKSIERQFYVAYGNPCRTEYKKYNL